MTHTNAIVTELIVAGFDDTHTVFLARAALARLQKEAGMATNDVAIVLRGDDGNVAVQQNLQRNADRNESSTFWETFADLLFAPESSTGTATEAVSGKGAAVGIDPNSVIRVADQLRLCKSGLFVLARDLAQRERVVGVLQGFDTELARVPLQH